jgi:hypothetical protein
MSVSVKFTPLHTKVPGTMALRVATRGVQP